MNSIIAVAGATGNMGGRIVKALRQHNAQVWALVRPGTDEEKVAALETTGARVIKVDLAQADDLQAALKGADTVVSALQGLADVIVGVQADLLNAATSAGVKRFIPSDYAADFTKTGDEENRNFDMRRDFHRVLDTAPIKAISVFNGMFMDILAYGGPMLDLKNKSVSYWGDADQSLDFTTMDDTAEVTALAALDPDAQRYVRVAGEQISARNMAALAGDMTKSQFQLVCAGSLDDLSATIAQLRAANPASEAEEFPRWQQLQYQRNMSSGKAKLQPVDNADYPQVQWTRLRDFLTKLLAR